MAANLVRHPCNPSLSAKPASGGWSTFTPPHHAANAAQRGLFLLRRVQHTAKRIFDRLRAEHAFTGGYTIVKDYVRAAKIGGQEMFVPLTHAPGGAQADFGEALVVIAGAEQKAHFMVFDLPHSDDCFVQAFPAETTEAFLEGHVRAFEYFGGVPSRILYDYVPGNIIVAKSPEDALEVREGKFVRFKKSLLRQRQIRPMEGCAAGHRTHREDL